MTSALFSEVSNSNFSSAVINSTPLQKKYKAGVQWKATGNFSCFFPKNRTPVLLIPILIRFQSHILDYTKSGERSLSKERYAMKRFFVLAAALVVLAGCANQGSRYITCPQCGEHEKVAGSCPCCGVELCSYCLSESEESRFEEWYEGYKEGGRIGYQDGYEAGWDIGYTEGANEGFVDGYTLVIDLMDTEYRKKWWSENIDFIEEYDIQY